MTGVCKFELDIVPQPWRRARVARVGRGVRHFQDSATRGYEQAVGLAAKAAMGGREPFPGAVAGWLTFSMPIPASWSHRKAQDARLGLTLPSVAPDLDNLCKAILDGLNGVVFLDDKQVVYLEATKRYADRPGVAVRFEEMGHDETVSAP